VIGRGVAARGVPHGHNLVVAILGLPVPTIALNG
jgi:hypothetical protein